ncbi:ceroid-lipofuscinosis neuronal protein 6 homolog [Mugil cephalus]|uniref:ceroid-lipofuscinosis neuronal protein 6 homolog n=1 Tax=Mugil cephalus TaxID=48193 RepID=UPI001FB7C1D8|nr:ceroid-lipofuscinosis neuronal protein 6 homolog [Mugil cephalus]
MKFLWKRKMQPSSRMRENSTLHAAAFMSSHSSGSAQTEVFCPKPRFHLDLWLCFTVQNWILHVGLNVVMLLLPADWFPLRNPGVVEYLQFLYNLTTPLMLLKILERRPRMLPRLAIHLGIISVVMGTSLHMVTNSITRRLLLTGYQLHLSVSENPVMKNLKPPLLADVFELLFYYDSTLGHLMWYVPLFLVLMLYFSGCFCHRKQKMQEEKMPTAAWVLLIPNAVYYWYMITEGQTFFLFIFTFFAMTATVMHQKGKGLIPDSNGCFMLYSFSAALCLVLIWGACLWNNSILKKRISGLIYVPQPGMVYRLYFCQNNN